MNPSCDGRRVCMLVYNNCTTDARVLKEASALSAAGHHVRIVAVLDRTTVPRELRDDIEIVRIDRDPPHYRLLRASRSASGRTRRLEARTRRLARRARRLTWVLAEGPRAFSERRPSARHFLQRSTLRLLLALAPIAAWSVASRALRALQIDVRPASPAPAPPTARRRHRGLAGVFRRTLMRFHKPLMFTDFYLRAFRMMRDERVDVVHAHDLNTLPVGVALARHTGARLIYDSHELYPEVSTLSRLEARVWRMVERALIGNADEVVTVCESIATELASRHGVAPPRVLLNCPPRRAQVLDDRGLLRRTLGPGFERGPLILYHGGFAPNRGLPALVRAAHHLHEGRLVLMGWGRLEEELRAIVAAERLAERVAIIGPVTPEELPAYTAGADIGVIPYEPVGLNNTYTTPNKLFEYMAAGVPIVASHLPEIVRFVRGLEVGTTFSVVEPRAIAAAIGEVLQDPQRAATMRANALRASQELCWEVESRKLLDLYGITAPVAVAAAR
jgi:glycosyltransferase involved in cell wall biosynthesis